MRSLIFLILISIGTTTVAREVACNTCTDPVTAGLYGAANLYDATVLASVNEFYVDIGWMIWNDKIDVYNPLTNVVYHVNLDLFEMSVAGIPYMIDPTMMTINVHSADGSQQSSSDVPRTLVANAARQLGGQRPIGRGFGSNPTFTGSGGGFSGGSSGGGLGGSTSGSAGMGSSGVSSGWSGSVSSSGGPGRWTFTCSAGVVCIGTG